MTVAADSNDGSGNQEDADASNSSVFSIWSDLVLAQAEMVAPPLGRDGVVNPSCSLTIIVLGICTVSRLSSQCQSDEAGSNAIGCNHHLVASVGANLLNVLFLRRIA